MRPLKGIIGNKQGFQLDPDLDVSARSAPVPLPRTMILLVIVFLLAAASFLSEISEHVFDRENLLGLVSLVKMDAEANLPTWFNSSLLLCCAGFALLIGSLKRQEHDRYGWHWLGLATFLLLLSIDDAGGIHERINVVLRERIDTGGVLFFPWLIAGISALVAFVVVFWPFVRSLPASTRRRLIVAFALYFGAAVGLEIVEGVYNDAREGGKDLGSGILTTFEDAMEMCGVIVAIAALSDYIQARYSGLRVRVPDGIVEPMGESGSGSVGRAGLEPSTDKL
jgi:hypothetical protein